MNARERNDLVVSWLTISIAFAWVIRSFLSGLFPFPSDFFQAFLVAATGVGTGFILHEMAHRSVARHFGAHAEFRAWNMGLIFALLSAVLFRIIFAAPGAVYIMGNIDARQSGLISLAGPLTNFLLGLLFLAVGFTVSAWPIGLIAVYGAMINFWLGFFNMLPFGPLDGKKILAWSPAVWAALFFPLLLLVFVF